MFVFIAALLVSLSSVTQAAPKGSAGDISDCGVISAPGNYQVKQDLPGRAGLLSSGNCIEITADSVVLDLGDRSITGQGGGAGVTDNALPLSNLEVRNGSISGFDNALDLSASTGSVVEKIRAFANSADGISLGAQAVARFNVAINNDRGLVMTCPASAVGNSAWDNTSEDFFLYNEQSCSSTDGLNSFGSSGGGGGDCSSVGLTNCSDACVDLATDEANCGVCGQQCGAGELCIDGQCSLTCQSGLDVCFGVCADLNKDEANCGGCGVACAAGELCVNGTCGVSCPSAQSDCGGLCVDLQTDEANCGGCALSCPEGAFCVGGNCETPPDCSNGIIEPGEVCDDGNNADGDGCSANCLSDETCGNGIIDLITGEACDDGNATSGDGCSASCRIEVGGSCSDNSQCSSGLLCENGTCAAKRLDGEACTTGNECASGNCTDQVCCDAICNGSCESCNEPGTVGTCTAAISGTLGSPSCSPYVCDGFNASCPISCSANDDCAFGFVCSDGSCISQ